MNKPERAFAEMIDADETGTVRWWVRNPESVEWATRIILPTGRRFFPDFAVGIAGRKTPDEVALVEIKDDGTGRLHEPGNLVKITAPHSIYRSVFWANNPGGEWQRLHLPPGLNRIAPAARFEIGEMAVVN